jgi:LuxR family maltose regulon positive regulatory protein
VLDKLGNEIDALAVLDRALGLAGPERIMRPFLCVGELMVPLLQKAAARRTTPKFTRELLLLLKADSGVSEALHGRDRGTGEAVSMDAQEWPIEPLTEREMEVLRLLNTRLSVPEIAREMYVAPSTIRTHIRNIYSKLDVHSRFELVLRSIFTAEAISCIARWRSPRRKASARDDMCASYC